MSSPSSRLGWIWICLALISPPVPPPPEPDQITVYTPAFAGPEPLASAVATVLTLDLWHSLRKAPTPNPGHVSFGDGKVVWGGPLATYSHEVAEAQAQDVSLLAQMIFWGKVYAVGDGAVVQSHLSIPAYHDFRTAHPELWTVRIRGRAKWWVLAVDLPQRRYSFEPIVLTREVITRYSRPDALVMYSSPVDGKIVGTVGQNFTAIEHLPGVSLVASSGKRGWVRLPELSRSVPEVVDFVGGVIRVFRSDWQGAEKLMRKVVANPQAPNELRTDALLYAGMSAAQQGHPSEATFDAARALSPDAQRCVIYAVMGRLADYHRLRSDQARLALARAAQRLLEVNRYLFPPEDQWYSQAAEALGDLASS